MRIPARYLSLIASLVLFVACSKKAVDDQLSGDGGGGGTYGLVGEGQFCSDVLDNSLGSNLNGTSYVTWLIMSEDGSYSYNVLWADGPCLTAANSSGHNFLSYSQAGTWETDGSAAGLSGATNVKFTVTTSTVSARQAYSLGATVKAYLNGSCGFSIGASPETAIVNSNGQNCAATSGFAFPNFPAASVTSQNVMMFDTGNMRSGSREHNWLAGAASYPTSLVDTYLGW